MARLKSGIWTAAHVQSLAPDAASLPAAREVLRKGGFGTVEPTGDGRGWWVVCRGITDTYQVSVRRVDDTGEFDCECTCPSYKYPCKHALALLLYLVDHPELRTEAEAPKAAASDFEGLLRAVFANPDDDTPRLVFADYLEENDQGDRAALIRYQCEQARLKSTAARYRELAPLVKAILAKVRKQIEPLPEGMDYEFRRGFLRLESVVSGLFDVGALPARLTALFRDGWVETLVTSFFYFGGYEDEEFEGRTPDARTLLGQIGELDVSRYTIPEEALVTLVADTAEARANGRLARVKVHKRSQKAFDRLLKAQQGEAIPPAADLAAERSYTGLNPRTFDLLLRAGHFGGARRLALGGELGDAELSSLLANADLSDLRRLRLEGWTLTRTGLDGLARGTALARLTDLDLGWCEIGGVAGALGAGTGLRGLEVLRLAECGLGDADVEALAKSKGFPNLQRLDLRMNYGVTARGPAALLAAAHVPRLSALDLHNTAVAGPAQLPLLLDARDRRHLALGFTWADATRAIEGSGVIVEVAGRGDNFNDLFDGLEECAGAKRVTQFTATRATINPKAVAALAAGFDPLKLWRLDLHDSPLRNDGAAALAAAFARFPLRELNLRCCRVQSAGVAALVKSPVFAGLRTLDLSQNNIGKAGTAALAKASTPPGLKELVLTNCRLTADEQKQLKATYGPRVKV